MDTATLTSGQEQAAWEAAGRALAPLHTLTNDWFGACRRDGAPRGAAETDPAHFVLTSLEDGIKRCLRAGALLPGEETFARAHLTAGVDAFAGEKAVPCHRDYTPRNWLVTQNDGIWRGAIDFEHTRWDVRARDLCRWWDREFLNRPDLVRAFFAGYNGGPLDERLTTQIRVMRLANALNGVGWSVEHDDVAFLELNRAALARLQQEHEP
jgi:Ser/Thr protein kinase RdoA (MazF antagonist)